MVGTWCVFLYFTRAGLAMLTLLVHVDEAAAAS